MARTFWWVGATTMLAACSAVPETRDSDGLPAPPGAICTMELRPAITVEPVDAQTGRPVTGQVLLIVRDGIYTDSAQARLPGSGNAVSAAPERSGTYTVTVQHPAYQRWQRTNVRVLRDECHVQTVRLRAELRPAG